MNRYLQEYSEKYGKRRIDNATDAESILAGDYSIVFLNTTIANISYSCWSKDRFGDPQVCSHSDRIGFLVDQSISHIDELIRNGKVDRRNLPGKEQDNELVENLIRTNLNHSETILSQQREKEVVAGTVDTLVNDIPDMVGKKIEEKLEEFLSPYKVRPPTGTDQQRAARAVSPPRNEIPSPAANENPAPGPNENTAPGPDENTAPVDSQSHPVKTPEDEFPHGELVQIKGSNKTHGNRFGTIASDVCKGRYLIKFDDGTSHDFQPRSFVRQRAYLLFEDEEAVMVQGHEEEYGEGELTVDLAYTSNDYVGVRVPDKGIFRVHKDFVKPTDW